MGDELEPFIDALRSVSKRQDIYPEHVLMQRAAVEIERLIAENALLTERLTWWQAHAGRIAMPPDSAEIERLRGENARLAERLADAERLLDQGETLLDRAAVLLGVTPALIGPSDAA